jgi:hypothetical protein
MSSIVMLGSLKHDGVRINLVAHHLIQHHATLEKIVVHGNTLQ